MTKKWYTPERMKASKKNIKKATTAWDEMSFSVAEGNIPKTLRVKNKSYKLYDVYGNRTMANNVAKSLRMKNIQARVRPITVGGTSLKGKYIRKREIYPVYTGGKKPKKKIHPIVMKKVLGSFK